MLDALWSRIRRKVPSTMREGVGAGLRFVVGPANPEYGTGANELPVQDALRRVLRPGDTFLDIGANVGFFTVIAAFLVGPRGRVVAFEPVPANARLVRRNVRLNRFRNVRVRQEAVSSEVGAAELILARFAGGASLASVGTPPDALHGIQVATTSVDAAIGSGEVPPPDVVKIDVEGAEYDVLAGMKRVLADHRPILLIEFDGPEEADVEARAAPCAALLAEAGYRQTTLPDSYRGDWAVRHVLATPLER